MELVVGALVLWFAWWLYARSRRKKHEEDVKRFEVLQARMEKVLEAERKWNDKSWWHTDRLDLRSMIYSHSQGVDDQAWFTDYLAVRLGTRDWWLRENRSSHWLCATEKKVEGPQEFWFPAKRLMHDPQSFLDKAYLECAELFRNNPGLTPDMNLEDCIQPKAPGHIWEPTAHAEGRRIEKSWEDFQRRAKELEQYQAKAIEQGSRCSACPSPNGIEDGRCVDCGKVLAKPCGCGFTNLPREVGCLCCGRRFLEEARQSPE